MVKAHLNFKHVKKVTLPHSRTSSWPWNVHHVQATHPPGMGIKKSFHMVCCKHRADFKVDKVKRVR